MILTIFTFIVFISQLIIAFTLIFWLFKFDKFIQEKNLYLEKSMTKISNIAKLVRGISEQLTELTPIWVENFYRFRDKIILSKLEGLLSAILFLHINTKVMYKIKKSKFLKAIFKGLSLVNNMI